MNTILEQFQDKINGTFSFFDRIIIKGQIRQFFSPSGKRHFLSEHNVLLKDFPAFAEQVTHQVVSHVESLTQLQGRLLIYLPSSLDSKEEKARAVLQGRPVKEGLICTISVVEPCQTLQPKKKDNGLLELVTVNCKCKYFYLSKSIRMLPMLTGVHPGNGYPWENQLPTYTAMLKYQRLQINGSLAPYRISSRLKAWKKRSTNFVGRRP